MNRGILVAIIAGILAFGGSALGAAPVNAVEKEGTMGCNIVTRPFVSLKITAGSSGK